MSPERKEVTLTIDGREVTAVEGEMLHDAAREGDVEIPVFCYEPKLGAPVGACRMCLVEIEGIPKLQTSCSTPVRDGMVVHTRTDQVKKAQNAVVEFLLVNHPLDCPVCDKGGECPLQDITQGWGPGKSRVIDEKRHFEKPIELSPLVAIDRERCILCYRCVRFSQEVSEDAQLQLLDRGDRTYVGTFDDRPYVSPFHGNITDLCPVGALTNYTYRFRARPWDIEQAGSVCTLCPSQCNVSFTVRDEKVKRVIARDNPGVDDGWLCDRGRYGFEMFSAEERVTEPRLKGGNKVDHETAIARAAEGLRARDGRVAAIVGDASNEEGFLIGEIVRAGLHSRDIDSRPADGPGIGTILDLDRPDRQAKVTDIDEADVILVLGTDPMQSSPILDLRIRKAIRRNGARLAVATERPTALDGGAEAIARYAPGQAAYFVGELSAALGGADNVATPLAESLREAAKVVVVWGERIGADGAAALLNLADALSPDVDGPKSPDIEDFSAHQPRTAGLLEVPDTTNARGLREAGVLPDGGPGLAAIAGGGRSTEGIRQALIDGELDGLVLVGVDPLRDFADTTAWEEAINAAEFVVCFSTFATATAAKADVLFPLETHAEKDGTVTHPDGRLQRVRPAAGRPGDIRPGWQTLAALSKAIGHDTGVTSQPTAFAALTEAVPFYGSITDEAIGGRGIRWQETDSASAFPGGTGSQQPTASLGRDPMKDDADPTGGELHPPSAAYATGQAPGAGADSPDTQRERASAEAVPVTGALPELLLGTYRDLWAGPITELNPPLKFLKPSQRLELSPEDAERLSLASGDQVRVTQGAKSLEATVAVKERVPEGVCFLAEGVAPANANALLNGHRVSVRIEKLSEVPA
ncbi:MAG TPA: NADH-quinone oxidoreductase subunit NuoG [Solirubrobacterales bacterium]|nr:NADH-quinone oxidoreductase subunit NuoG [Solirubrobacterales bacterium]